MALVGRDTRAATAQEAAGFYAESWEENNMGMLYAAVGLVSAIVAYLFRNARMQRERRAYRRAAILRTLGAE